MTDPFDYETRFEARLVAHAARATRPFDAAAIAAAAAIPQTRGIGVRPWVRPLMGSGGRVSTLRVAFALALLALAVTAGAILVGSVLRDRTPQPDHLGIVPPSPTASPSRDDGPTTSPIPGPYVYADEFAISTSLVMPMREPLLVPLLDDRVLILGNDIAEVYDPNNGSQERIRSLLDSGVMSATRAADGRVLVIGLRPGVGNANEGLITQVFDPRTDAFTAAGPMVTPRQDACTVALADGRILIDGGRTAVDGPDIPLTAPEIFDPASSTFEEAGFKSGLTSVCPMTLLADGRVLIHGGRGEHFPNHTTRATGTRAAVLYDPATGSVARTGKPLHAPRFVLSGADGGVLATWDTGTGESGIDAWDPRSGTFRQIATTPSMSTQTVGLDDGRLLATMGYDTLLIDPSGAVSTLPVRGAWDPSLAVLADGRVMIAGGTVDGVYRPDALGNLRSPKAVDTVVLFR